MIRLCICTIRLHIAVFPCLCYMSCFYPASMSSAIWEHIYVEYDDHVENRVYSKRQECIILTQDSYFFRGKVRI